MTREERNKVLEEAAQACEQTCGEWHLIKRNVNAPNEFDCPCAVSVRSLKSPPLAAPSRIKEE